MSLETKEKNSLIFTYPSQVEVGPSSFLKIKMLGKGDVGRVYLVREKKTSKLYAMKGNGTFTLPSASPSPPLRRRYQLTCDPQCYPRKK
jgi:hypothetical protein